MTLLTVLSTCRRRWFALSIGCRVAQFSCRLWLSFRCRLTRCDNNERLGALCCHKLRSSDAKAEFELQHKLYAWVELASADGKKKAQKRKERCVPYDLRHAYAIRARETTSWSYADVAAVMGHSPEVHRRTYLSEISGEQTKAAVVRRLLGNEPAA